MALELDEWLQGSFSCTRSSCSPTFKDFQFSDKVFNVILTLFRPPCNSISLKFFKNQLHLFKNPFKYIVKSNCFADKKELFKRRLSRVVIYFFEVMIVTRPFKKKILCSDVTGANCSRWSAILSQWGTSKSGILEETEIKENEIWLPCVVRILSLESYCSAPAKNGICRGDKLSVSSQQTFC